MYKKALLVVLTAGTKNFYIFAFKLRQKSSFKKNCGLLAYTLFPYKIFCLRTITFSLTKYKAAKLFIVMIKFKSVYFLSVKKCTLNLKQYVKTFAISDIVKRFALKYFSGWRIRKTFQAPLLTHPHSFIYPHALFTCICILL